jgi:hypothetical protein
MQGVIRASDKAGAVSSANFDPITMLGRWPTGFVKGLLQAVCPNPFELEPATVHKKAVRVLAALEVLANARSQKHHVLQRFLSDVRRQDFIGLCASLYCLGPAV